MNGGVTDAFERNRAGGWRFALAVLLVLLVGLCLPMAGSIASETLMAAYALVIAYCAIVYHREVRHHKRTEEALRESKERYDQLAAQSGTVAWEVDAQGLYTYVSDVAETAWGYRPEELVGRVHFYDLHPADGREAFKATALEVFRRKEAFRNLENLVELKDGRRIWVTTSGLPLLNSDGTLCAYRGSDTNITDRKRAEEKLQELYAAAEAATRAKSEFLANMSHEIRTPMTAILGYADVLIEEIDEPSTREHVQVIQRNGNHLLDLINGILDLSKVEAEKTEINPTRCSPVELLAEVISLMRVRADAKQLDLRTDLIGPLPETVLTDALRLRQVLVNLIGNAIKFTDQGEVRVTVRLADSPTLRLCFDVIDTGIGMNEEQVAMLFHPFVQVDNSATRKFGGSGLGLCISKRLTEALGGTIEVQSSPGRGSTFRVLIDPGPLDGIRMLSQDLQKDLSPPPIPVPTAAGKTRLRGRILLAEDGPDNQCFISFLLKKAGADVAVEGNGQAALDAALAAREAGRPFDVILMDMQMPIMDGYTATRQLRHRGHTAPIIALTAHAMAEDRQKCLDAGCTDYITKPIDREKFLALVAQYTNCGQSAVG